MMSSNDDDFQGMLSNEITNVQSLRHLQYGKKLHGPSRAKAKKPRGPKPKSLQLKLYHLPDASGLPHFKARREYEVGGLIRQHMEQGYGK